MEFMSYNGEWQVDGKPVETFPVQDTRGQSRVPVVVAEEAYKAYTARYGSRQTLKRLGERGGFGAAEIAILLFQRCQRLSR